MSSHPKLARLATQALARDVRDAPAPTAADEAEAIAAIAGAIQREARARRLRRVAIGALATAACVAVAIGAARFLAAPDDAKSAARSVKIEATSHALAGAVVLLRQGREVSLDEGSALGPGDRLVAPADGRAAVNLSTGTQLFVEGGSDFNVVDLGAAQEFVLRAGALRADVAKLGAGQRFLVRTGDAEVEVRGTSFRVAVVAPSASCANATSTRVFVTEGTVVVRSSGVEERVPAGHQWPAGCTEASVQPRGALPFAAAPPVAAPPSMASPSLAPPSNAPLSNGQPPPATLAAAATVSPPQAKTAPAARDPEPGASAARGASAASDIATENRLYAEAASAKRSGATREAIAAYDAFLARYPSSQLAESATVERMRLLALTDRTAAAAAARDYLSRYPAGFARPEAAAIAATSP